MKEETKLHLKSRINLSGINFLIWFSIWLLIYLSPISNEFLYWKMTWLLISISTLSIWGYFWDRTSERIYEELTKKVSEVGE